MQLYRISVFFITNANTLSCQLHSNRAYMPRFSEKTTVQTNIWQFWYLVAEKSWWRLL